MNRRQLRAEFRPWREKAAVRAHRAVAHARMPEGYHQIAREQKRARDIALAVRLGGVSRHIEEPAHSDEWVRTGIWPVQS